MSFCRECGDGVYDNEVEACDDGNLTPNDGCESNCLSITPNYSCFSEVKALSYCFPCGDGKWAISEGCDAGNVNPSDGCSMTCQINSGWTCHSGFSINQLPENTSPSKCWKCNDGKWEEGEECDDGDSSKEGCLDTC